MTVNNPDDVPNNATVSTVLLFFIWVYQVTLKVVGQCCCSLGEYAKSPKGLKVNDRVRVDVDVQRLEELQTERDAWNPELEKVSMCIHGSSVGTSLKIHITEFMIINDALTSNLNDVSDL